jgi:ABC-type iron transport system FetAB permease component
MYLILGAAALATAVVGVGATRRHFTPDHRLVRLARDVP